MSVMLDRGVGVLPVGDESLLPLLRPTPQGLLAELLQGDAQARFPLSGRAGVDPAQFHDVQQGDDLRQ